MSRPSAPPRVYRLPIVARLRERILPASPEPEYPPMSSIPLTSPSRLAAAVSEADGSPTVLYLAYGSNLSAQTFLGRRGIRPISAVNVSAPMLDLTFDLPGLPYSEPCFANTAFRKVPGKPLPPGIPDPINPAPPRKPGAWNKGLIGVVYEVTKEDYAHIVETEGAGASYTDILVPCFALPIRMPTPEDPKLPKPFFAHTLYAPNVPLDDEVPRRPPAERPWYWKLVRPEYRTRAQPSARYLKLIVDGAREHELPEDYREYLAGLTAYGRTSWRQELGRWVFGLLCMPMLLLMLVLAPLLSSPQGGAPRWLTFTVTATMSLTWMAHDKVGRHVFGDGERTEEKDGDEETGARCGKKRWCGEGVPDEKKGLMDGEED